MISSQELRSLYEVRFGQASNLEYYFAPGRVNLIGEHIDYNGGLVLPAAISLGITAAFQPEDSGFLEVYACDFDEQVRIELDNLIAPEGKSKWPLYICGTMKVVKAGAGILRGGKLVIKSDLPLGSGLSSSAAMECLIAYLMNPGYYEAHRTQLALDAQRAEREEVGVQCGIMDQFAVSMGKAGQAILLDCATLDYQYIPFETGDYQLIIINSNYPRTLADSKYNERRAECEAALKALQAIDPAQQLVDVHEMSIVTLQDDVLYARAKHVVTEHKRVIAAADALQTGQLEYFGNLLWASHQSLDQDYEVAGDALNIIVHYAGKFSGCIGARMTGAGFGGCAIAFVQKDKTKRFCDYVGQKYEQETGRKADFYIAEISDGVRRLS
jgi:galactokinase